MVQVLHAGATLNAMFHVAVRPLITSIAISVILTLSQLDVLLCNDARI